jgi:hypothetical protein
VAHVTDATDEPKNHENDYDQTNNAAESCASVAAVRVVSATAK